MILISLMILLFASRNNKKLQEGIKINAADNAQVKIADTMQTANRIPQKPIIHKMKGMRKKITIKNY